MTKTPTPALHLPAIVQAFAMTRVMGGLRPTQGGNANPRHRGCALRTSAQSIGLLMQAMTNKTQADS